MRSHAAIRASGASVTDARGSVASYRRRRVLTAAEVEQILDRYRAGERIQTIAVDLEVDRRQIRKLLYEHGAASPPVRLTARQIRRAAELYERGSSLADVAEQFGVSATTIRRCLTKQGVDTRPSVAGPSRQPAA